MIGDLVQLRTMLIVVLALFIGLLYIDPPFSIAGIVLSALITLAVVMVTIQVHHLVESVRSSETHSH